MTKQKASKQSEKGALTKFQTDFLKMSEAERQKRYGYDTSQYYGRIVGSRLYSNTLKHFDNKLNPPSRF